MLAPFSIQLTLDKRPPRFQGWNWGVDVFHEDLV